MLAHLISAMLIVADPTALTVQADAAHEAGQLDEAARLYARAYEEMTPDEKAALGEVIVSAALDDLRASFEATGDASHARAASALLDAYARDAGGSLPDALAEHRAWTELPEPEIAEPEREQPPAPSTHRPRREAPVDREPPRKDAVPPVAIGLGVALAIGGAAMIGVGAPLGRRATRARDEALSDPRFLALDPENPETIAYVDHYGDYVRREHTRTAALVSAGSVLVTAGLGLAIYGAVRLVRHRERATARVQAIPGGAKF